MKIGVFGGTFDPPHLGHLVLAEAAREQLHLDKVMFIPAGDPWRKADRKVTAASHRLAMTRLAVAGHNAFEVEDFEVVREGPSYTVETLEILREHLGSSTELFLVLGEDALADVPNWHKPERLVELATLAVANRRGVTMPELPFDRGRVVTIVIPGIDISSTELRERASRGLSLRYQVPDAVRDYIQANNLYQGASPPA
jgi:nicotinate-nucleotide adenylyltransferase